MLAYFKKKLYLCTIEIKIITTLKPKSRKGTKIMNIKAYRFENSVEVELTEISRIKKGYLVTSSSNFEERNSSPGYYSYVNVEVYEPGNRYHYEVSIIDKEHGTVSSKYFYSSSKNCDPQVVACELVKMY